jgi:hypothetical protein
MTPDHQSERFIFTDAEVKLGFPLSAPFEDREKLEALAQTIRETKERQLEQKRLQYIAEGYPADYVRENMMSRSLITIAGLETDFKRFGEK